MVSKSKAHKKSSPTKATTPAAKKKTGSSSSPSAREQILKIVADSYCRGKNLVKIDKLVTTTKLAKKTIMNAVGKLKKEKILNVPEAGSVGLTEEGVEYMGEDCKILSPEEKRAKMMENLSGKSLKLYELLQDGETRSKEDVAKELGFEGKKQKGFVNLIGKNKTGGMVEYPDKDHIKMTDDWLAE